MKNFFAKMGATILASATAVVLIACGSDSSANSGLGGEGIIGGGLTDSRDGQSYKAVKIGDKLWMAENLNYQTGKSKCYADNPKYCDKYGRLYTWDDAQNACPSGWRLPSKEEFEELRTIAGQKAGDEEKAGIMLKSKIGWAEDEGVCGNGTDGLGFAALPAGFYNGNDGNFYYEGVYANFWSSTEYVSDPAYSLDLYYDLEYAIVSNDNKNCALSVRCIKD